MSLLDHILYLDRKAFLLINGCHSTWGDMLMAGISEMLVWVPLYAFLLWQLQRRTGWKGLGWAVLVVAAMIFASDTGSVVLFKNTFQRLRPCHAPELQGLVHLVNDHCGGRFGFVSSHASNHFAIAAFMAMVFGGHPRWAAPTLLAWAALVSYSRIYLGAHYPGDVLVGGIYGLTLGIIFFGIFRRIAMSPMPLRS